MHIAEDNIQRFKNWFFGRVPAYEYDDEEVVLDTVYVNTEQDLPRDGDEDLKYHVAETGDTFRFKDGVYTEFKNYVFGVEEKYRDPLKVIRFKETLTDHSFELPSISADQVKAGSSASLSTLYNIMALRLDLAQIRKMHVEGRRTTLMEFLGKGSTIESERNFVITEWFRREHALLYRLLLSSYPSEQVQYKEVVDALFHHGYILTWDSAKRKALFKVEDFTVYL